MIKLPTALITILSAILTVALTFDAGAAGDTTASDTKAMEKLKMAIVFGDVAYPQDSRIQKTYFDHLRDGLTLRGKWGLHNYYPEKGFQYEVLQALRAMPLIDEYKPEVVIFHFSYTDTYVHMTTNGLAPMTDVVTFKSRLTAVTKYCRERQARVILMTPVHMQWNDGLRKAYGATPPFNVKDPDGFNAIAIGHIEAVREVAREQQVELLDVYEILRKVAQTNRKKPLTLMLDSMHINNDGHKLIGKKLAEMILKPPQPTPNHQ